MIKFKIHDLDCAFEMDGGAYLTFHIIVDVSLFLSDGIYKFNDSIDLIVAMTALSAGKESEYSGYMDSSYFKAYSVNKNVRILFKGYEYSIDADNVLIENLKKFWIDVDKKLNESCNKEILWDFDFPKFNSRFNIIIK